MPSVQLFMWQLHDTDDRFIDSFRNKLYKSCCRFCTATLACNVISATTTFQVQQLLVAFLYCSLLLKTKWVRRLINRRMVQKSSRRARQVNIYLNYKMQPYFISGTPVPTYLSRRNKTHLKNKIRRTGFKSTIINHSLNIDYFRKTKKLPRYLGISFFIS